MTELSPEVREALRHITVIAEYNADRGYDTTACLLLNACMVIQAALIRGAEAERQLEAHKAGVINRGPRHPMQGLEGMSDE